MKKDLKIALFSVLKGFDSKTVLSKRQAFYANVIAVFGTFFALFFAVMAIIYKIAN